MIPAYNVPYDWQNGAVQMAEAYYQLGETDYSILFNRLCERADDVYGGRLPIHVRCLIDEAANIGQIPNLERLMATIRSLSLIHIYILADFRERGTVALNGITQFLHVRPVLELSLIHI